MNLIFFFLKDDGTNTSILTSLSDRVEDGNEVDNDRQEDLTNQYSQHELNQILQRQRQIMAEELQKVIDQRNEARQTIISLERKLSAAKLRPRSDGKTQELMATLDVVRRERDVTVARLKTLMADIAETKLLYKLVFNHTLPLH
ncbi:hypothetical protein PoB_002811400 [Plakobranchus ocellatus]|uniref:Uncharacterized protein n=1 Tax=Plakobranchus ocellatus TaxID=259542 RepID=A0AAV4A1W4_9GAST|nr:hypothetical protein PoB_002811400 [Plakobranchus ocellatus]